MSAPGLVSALVCTRNRPGPVVGAVRALLDGADGFELIVIDQSDGPETEQALAPLSSDARLRYVRSKTRGKGFGLNEGLALAQGSIVVCTDDDCAPPRDWVRDMAAVLESQPSAAILFCQVIPVPHDTQAGYVPAYHLKHNRLLRSISGICGGLGLGAGMALRRDFALSIGGFDESFGPGGRFPSADEWDIAMRALLSGKHVFETEHLSIVHDGFRSFEQGREHARRDWLALGAVCAKPLRAGRYRALIVPLWLFNTKALWPPLADILRGRKPRGLVRILAFLQGFKAGLSTPVDQETLRFSRAP